VKKSAIDEYSAYLFHQGTNRDSYRLFGAHTTTAGKKKKVRFAVWAPHAQKVSVVGDFNGWDQEKDPLELSPYGSGIWTAEIEGVGEGDIYKYAITTSWGETILKSDPYAFAAQVRPDTASVVHDLSYKWGDRNWIARRKKYDSYHSPMNIYEVHLGSWQTGPDGELLSYREIADRLVPYVKEMHYTHVELMPLCEYPFDGSWGYQATGYFAATSRYGAPEDLMYLVDRLHQAGIGVLIDWVPGHYCKDAHGLRYFDGEPLYESGNPLLAENRDWDTMNFDYGRPEVKSFLISSALFWLREFHMDGIRIDAVAAMLYLDYGKKDGEWQANKYGGRENLEAVEFLRLLNEAVFTEFPHVLMVAEESTAWPMVTKPGYEGGLGFNYKWNMGWMNDMLRYMATDPLFRKGCHDLVTFSLYYAFAENFILPLSHDEVVHGKRSLLDKMPGTYEMKFAGLRAFLGYWMSHPGKKLLFMGSEFGQFIEWKYDQGLDWHLLDYPMHKKMQSYVKMLNEYYLEHPEFFQVDDNWTGFSWISCDDRDNSVIDFYRRGKKKKDETIVVCNFTPEKRTGYRIGVDEAGSYTEVFNSDDKKFGGSGIKNKGVLKSEAVPQHGREQSLVLTLPPLSVIYLRKASSTAKKAAAPRKKAADGEIKKSAKAEKAPAEKKDGSRAGKARSSGSRK